ncbi:CAP-Gly domain-containing linker protein 1-like isoform X25 [Ostrea edulis]|uniref:CAP-Gly domain-containing linker protein 1-like isoform X25 n=1 Tax=Ostrea edulis TaxID=37623 RepID=UPI0024AF15CF|nr:CAP-Gly domain-containing linker protein 1-like isoform X25 [Ostrea edulis]XP_056001916.1 CAP-Gly domain-containing linker protein 1-like isoform X25 [Ostrea edulis]
MSLPRPSGLKAPSKIGRPTGLPHPRSAGTGIPTPGSVHKAQSPDGLPPPPIADDFIIGDRVWVSGTKPGQIAYIGETQFASGEWAGVVLDNPEGKNDGSVQGVRYFQCEPKKGVFSRISKLSRTPGLTSETPKPEDAISETGGGLTAVKTNGTSHLPTSGLRPTTPKPLGGTRALSTSSSSLNKAGMSSTAAKKTALKVGDRVLVSGTKTGTLRYVGSTDFAKGDWAGVELDEKQGKNDGAVSGKRYFECRPMFGLFAPVHKVTRLTSGNITTSMSASTPSPQSRSLMNTSLRMSRERSGSQDSVSSISSTASSVSRSRVRLGVNSLSSNQAKTSQRPSSLNLTATTQALQKALKEKEEHIEQLLKERDLERAEVARAAAQVDEAEGQLANMRSEQDRFREDTEDVLVRLRMKVEELEKERGELNCRLEDERRKVEDLQFQIEEEAISKDDLESRTEVDEEKLRSTEKELKKEKDRADKNEQEFFTLKAMLKDQTDRLTTTEEMNMSYLDQMEELTHKLSQAESKVKSFESSRLEEGAKASQVSIELVEKSNRLVELEDVLSTRDKEIKELHSKLHEVCDELSANEVKKQNMQETINDLTTQLCGRDEASNQLSAELQNMKSQLSELQRKLDSSEELNNQITEEKTTLEHQMSEMMKNSGDSSKRLSMLNDQVQEKNRKIQDLQAALSNSTQQLGKLNDEIENLKGETIRERENIIIKYEESAKTQNNQIEELQKELSKAKTKMQKMTEDHKKDNEDALSRKIKEIEELKKQLQDSIEEQERQSVQTQAHKQVLERITMEKEALQFEKEKTEKQVKRLESERDTANTELIQARVEVAKAQSEREAFTASLNTLEEKLQDLGGDVEKAHKAKNQVQKELDAVSEEKAKITEERDRLQDDTITTKASLQQKDMHIEELQKENDKLKGEISVQRETLAQVSQEESASSAFSQQLEESQKAMSDLQKAYLELEAERDTMKAQLTFANLVAEERTRLEDQNQTLNREVEDMQISQELDELQNTNTSLQSQLDNTSQVLQQKTDDLEKQKKQISNLQNENSSLEVYRSKVQKMDAEKSEFLEKISKLENLLKEAKTNASNMTSNDTTGNPAISKLTEEKDSALGQVEFLNSVIVDLQKKNSELKTRLEIMESGVVTNGDGDSSMEPEAPKTRAPPRLFCDICDLFDQHDTDDCPLQAMDYDEDTPSPTQYHGDRKASRPYCDICEEFHDPCVMPTCAEKSSEGNQTEFKIPSPSEEISDAFPPGHISNDPIQSPEIPESSETSLLTATDPKMSEGLPANYKYLKNEEFDNRQENDELAQSENVGQTRDVDCGVDGERLSSPSESGDQTEGKMDESCRVS